MNQAVNKHNALVSETNRHVESHAIILFDGVCNLCNASVNFIIDRDAEGYFKFAPLQSDFRQSNLGQSDLAGCREAADSEKGQITSIVLVENGACYTRSTAALRIARRLDGWWPLGYAGIFIPTPIRDRIYDWIARNRYRWFGKTAACRLPTPELRARFLDGIGAPPDEMD